MTLRPRGSAADVLPWPACEDTVHLHPSPIRTFASHILLSLTRSLAHALLLQHSFSNTPSFTHIHGRPTRVTRLAPCPNSNILYVPALFGL